jgi:hypothetical protein
MPKFYINGVSICIIPTREQVKIKYIEVKRKPFSKLWWVNAYDYNGKLLTAATELFTLKYTAIRYAKKLAREYG